MFRHNRFRIRVPPQFRHHLILVERSLIPIIIVQIIRTVFFFSTLDMFLLSLFIGLYAILYLDLI